MDEARQVSRRDCESEKRPVTRAKLWWIAYIAVSATLVSVLLIFNIPDLQPPQSEYAVAQLNSSGVSGYISPPTLPCDEECRRFRRLLASWPSVKPKAVVVLLLRPSIPKTFELSSRLFSDNFNDAYGYPVIVFHEETTNTEAYRQQLRSLAKSRLYFQGLWSAVNDYAQRRAIRPKFRWAASHVFYNNFEVSDLAVWRSPEYRDYIDYIDKTGGIYYRRWGDAPIKTLAVTLFVPKDRIHQFQDRTSH